MSGDTLQAVNKTLNRIKEVNGEIDNLQDTRRMLADPLEKAARRYYDHRRDLYLGLCARCYFVLIGLREDQTCAVFSTDCSWCGPGSQTLAIRVTDLAQFLPN